MREACGSFVRVPFVGLDNTAKCHTDKTNAMTEAAREVELTEVKEGKALLINSSNAQSKMFQLFSLGLMLLNCTLLIVLIAVIGSVASSLSSLAHTHTHTNHMQMNDVK